MTSYRAQALALVGLTALAALVFFGLGAAGIVKTTGLFQAVAQPAASCGCGGFLGTARVNGWLLTASSLLAAGFLFLVVRAAIRSAALYQATQRVGHAGASALGIHTIGFLRPRIVFPAAERRRFTPEERSSILAHEETHVAWHDPLLLFLFDLAAAFFVWVPGFAGVRRRFRLLLELDADTAALRRRGTRKPLGTALMKSLDAHRSAEALAVSFFGMTEARLRRIVRLGVPLPLSALAVPLGVVALALAGFFAFLPHVGAETVRQPPTLDAFVQCVAMPQCPRQLLQSHPTGVHHPLSTLSPRARFDAMESSRRAGGSVSLIIVYDAE